MNFCELERRFVRSLRERVHRGEITERGLARITGISQPHIHHVLNGKRKLSPGAADEVMLRLRLDILDLIDAGDMLEWTQRHETMGADFTVRGDPQYAENEQGGQEPGTE